MEGEGNSNREVNGVVVAWKPGRPLVKENQENPEDSPVWKVETDDYKIKCTEIGEFDLIQAMESYLRSQRESYVRKLKSLKQTFSTANSEVKETTRPTRGLGGQSRNRSNALELKDLVGIKIPENANLVCKNQVGAVRDGKIIFRYSLESFFSHFNFCAEERRMRP